MIVAILLGAGCGGEGGEGESDNRHAGVGVGGRPFKENGLSLILISIDTCRPDRLGCYGYDAGETPIIDRLALSGSRFNRAVTSAPLTLPAHSTFMTSQYPYRHRVRNNGTYKLSDKKTTLAEVLQEGGYRTGAVLGAFPLDSRFGLAQGFDEYDDQFPSKESDDIHDVAERIAEDVVNRAVQWLSGNRKKKSFLFLHFFDPHWRYEAPEPFRSRFKDSPYDAEIAYVDFEIGRLLEALEQFGLRERTIIVISWPDHDDFDSAPFRRGGIVESQVRAVDIAPTLLDLLGLPPLADAEGRSLVPLLVDPERSLDLVNYAETFSPLEDYGWSEVRSLSTDEWKYILLPDEELYRLSEDPGEEHNCIADYPEKAAEFRALLDDRLVEDRARAGEGEVLEIDEESRAKLEALGYVTARRRSSAETGGEDRRADPKLKIESLTRFFTARTLQGKGDVEEALAIYEELEPDDSRNPELLKAMAGAYITTGKLDLAEEIIERAYQIDSGSIQLLNTISSLHIVRKDYDKSIAVLEEILTIDPKFEGGHVRLGAIYLLTGNTNRAVEEYQEEIVGYPESPDAYNGLGKVYITIGRAEEAIKYYKKAIEFRPDFAEAYYNLANVYSKQRNLGQAVVHYRRAIEYDGGRVDAYYNLALLAKDLGERAESFSLLKKSVEVEPKFAKGHYGIANYYREGGMLGQAIEEYRIAYELSPDDPDILLNYGVALAGLQRYPEAIALWEEAGRVAPNTGSGRTALENSRLAREQMGGIQ